MSEWRPVVGFEGIYEVSDIGEVKSFHEYKPRILKIGIDNYGYCQVNLKKDGISKCKKIHSLVAEAFIGPRPYSFHVNHKDGIKVHNNLRNLEYCTNKENMAHAVGLGLFPKGEHNAAAVATEEIVRAIRHEYIYGSRIAGSRALGKKYGVSSPAVLQIVNNRTWKHIL